jgi:hypothetical protein
VLFFAKTTDLFSARRVAVCGHDDGQGFSAPLLSLKRRYGSRLLSNFNAGILKFPKSRYDLDLIEDFLGRSNLLIQPAMVEQTLFCLMAGSGPVWQTTQNDIHCSCQKTALEPSALAVHLIYSMKANWREYLAFQPADRSGTVGLVSTNRLTYADIVARKLRRVLRLQAYSEVA